ncbi:MAG: PAS domain-containing sensor histidine kinase [Chitinophagaceae bacterium]|nr:MAG: PAS domain-containing sensor histidine kinase [Chitinophagaceae bacterium]
MKNNLQNSPRPAFPVSGIIRRMVDQFVYGTLNSSYTFEERKFAIRYNQFFLCAILFFMAGFLFKFFNGLYLSSFVCLGSFGLSLLNYLLLHRNTYRRHLAKYSLLALVNVAIVGLSYVEGLHSGTYIFLFPFIVCQTFILNYDEQAAFRTSIIISLVSIMMVFTISPPLSTLQHLASDNYRSIFYLNCVLAFVISCLFSYIVIKENKKNEIGLLQERLFLDTLFNTALDAIFIVDQRTGQIVNCNTKAVDLFNSPGKNSLLGTTIDRWVISQYNADPLPAEVVGYTKEIWEGEVKCITGQGLNFVGAIFVSPFRDEIQPLKKISIFDITDRKNAEEALIDAKVKAEEAALSKARFVSNMSHELRTPLNGIIGTTNLLLQENILAEQKEHFDILKYSSEHMLELINDVLDVNKIDAGRLEIEKKPNNLKLFIDRIETIFHNQFHSKNIAFVVKVDPKLDRKFIFDPTRLGQVLQNLLSNALKFTHRGSVTLDIKCVSASSDAATVEFSVTDTGIGIESKKLPHVFERFYQADVMTTRKYGGSGLGLSISKKLIELYKGELKVESELYKGSRFHFMLTLNSYVEKKPLIQDTSQQQPLNSTARVLIAEDNPVNMMIARRFLQKWNLEIFEATDGQKAIELFNKGQYDILLIDLEMPEKDGYMVLNEVRESHPHLPVIAFTAASFENMGPLLKEKGFTDFVQKPFKPEELHAKILKFVRNPAA